MTQVYSCNSFAIHLQLTQFLTIITITSLRYTTRTGCAKPLFMNNGSNCAGGNLSARKHQGEWYHESCAATLFDPVCGTCGYRISSQKTLSNENYCNGRDENKCHSIIMYKEIPFWSERMNLKFCSHHNETNTVKCFSCDRFQLYGRYVHKSKDKQIAILIITGGN